MNMIINDLHRFCYFAIPKTGSSAISALLLTYPYSKLVVPRHISFEEFQKTATDQQKQYLTFCTVRNPLDIIVTSYFKKKNDHNGRFSRGTFRNGRKIGTRSMQEFRFIQQTNASFGAYFTKFYNEPWRLPRHENTVASVDKLIRFETMQRDLEHLLNKLNLPIKTLPVVNQTQERRRNFLHYYTPEIIPMAKNTLTHLMQEWGYQFPAEWE